MSARPDDHRSAEARTAHVARFEQPLRDGLRRIRAAQRVGDLVVGDRFMEAARREHERVAVHQTHVGHGGIQRRLRAERAGQQGSGQRFGRNGRPRRNPAVAAEFVVGRQRHQGTVAAQIRARRTDVRDVRAIADDQRGRQRRPRGDEIVVTARVREDACVGAGKRGEQRRARVASVGPHAVTQRIAHGERGDERCGLAADRSEALSDGEQNDARGDHFGDVRVDVTARAGRRVSSRPLFP